MKTTVKIQYRLTKIIITIIEEDECLGIKTTTTFVIRITPLGFSAQFGGLMGASYAGLEGYMNNDRYLIDASYDVAEDILHFNQQIEDVSTSESGGGGFTGEY